MATTLAVELAANRPPLSDCLAGHPHLGLAKNQWQRIFAHCPGTVSVRLQPCHDDGPRVGSAGASEKVPNKDGNRHGWRAATRPAPSTARNGTIHSCTRSAPVPVARLLLQCFFDATEERVSAKFFVCRRNDGPGFSSVGVSRREAHKASSTKSFHSW